MQNLERFLMFTVYVDQWGWPDTLDSKLTSWNCQTDYCPQEPTSDHLLQTNYNHSCSISLINNISKSPNDIDQ